MDYWMKREFTLSGVTGLPARLGMFIASKGSKHAVLVTKFDGSLERASEWFATKERAQIEAKEMALQTV
jgi:hypothetical protein